MKLFFLASGTLLILLGCENSSFRSTGNNQTPSESQDLQQSDAVAALADCGADNPAMKIKSIQLSFTERTNCRFGEADNLPAQSGVMTAREFQIQDISLPSSIELCSFTLNSNTDDLHYDDYLFITMNNTVLVASESGWADKLEKKEDTVLWDWQTIRGSLHADVEGAPAYGTPYCLDDPNCILPKHDGTGKFSYATDSGTIKKLSDNTGNLADMSFKIIATGDNNTDDCDHSSFNINLEIAYFGAEF